MYILQTRKLKLIIEEKNFKQNVAKTTNIIKEAYEEIYNKIHNNFLTLKNDSLIKSNYRDDTSINYKSKFDDIKKLLKKDTFNYNIKKEVTFLNLNIFAIKPQYLPNNKIKINGKNITNDITYDNNLNLNTPIIITYKNIFFKTSGYNYINQWRCT